MTQLYGRKNLTIIQAEPAFSSDTLRQICIVNPS